MSGFLFFPLTETIKVYDGNVSMKRKAFRNITISRNATKDQIVAACLRAFNIYDDPKSYIITDAYGSFAFAFVFLGFNSSIVQQRPRGSYPTSCLFKV